MKKQPSHIRVKNYKINDYKLDLNELLPHSRYSTNFNKNQLNNSQYSTKDP